MLGQRVVSRQDYGEGCAESRVMHLKIDHSVALFY